VRVQQPSEANYNQNGAIHFERSAVASLAAFPSAGGGSGNGRGQGACTYATRKYFHCSALGAYDVELLGSGAEFPSICSFVIKFAGVAVLPRFFLLALSFHLVKRQHTLHSRFAALFNFQFSSLFSRFPYIFFPRLSSNYKLSEGPDRKLPCIAHFCALSLDKLRLCDAKYFLINFYCTALCCCAGQLIIVCPAAMPSKLRMDCFLLGICKGNVETNK